MLLLVSCRKALHFSLLFVHNFSNGSLCLVIKLLQFFAVIYFSCINLWITNKNSVPNFLFSFFQIEIKIIFPFNILNFPNRLWRINFFIKFAFNDYISIFIFNRYLFWIYFHFKLFCSNLWIYLQCDFDLSYFLTPWIFLVLTTIVSIN